MRLKVANFLFDTRFGGPQRRVIQVASVLQSKGVDTVAVFPEAEGNALAKAGKAGISVRQLRYQRPPALRGGLRAILKWLLMLPADIYRCYAFCKREAVDVVHVNGAVFPAPAIAARLAGKRLLWHLNDTVLPRRMAHFMGYVVRLLSSQIVVAAYAVADHYGVPREKVSVLYAPVDVQQFAPRKSEGDPDVLTVGILANWNPLKGVDTFVAAMGKVKERLPVRLSLKLGGAKLASHVAYAEQVERLIRDLELEEDIAFMGFTEDTPALLATLDLLVMSSNSEACPMAVLEGMAAQLPVVATDVGGVRELLYADGIEAGYVVPLSAEGIAEAVLELAADRDLRMRLGRNGRLLAERHFSLEQCVQEHLECYTALARKRTGDEPA